MHIKTIVLALLLSSVNSVTYAALTDLANVPLANTSTLSPKPNIMFILDDSGSMGFEWLPDDVISGSNAFVPQPSTVNKFKAENACYSNSLYNKIYYDPAKTYTPPVKSDGSYFANSNFTAALNDGYVGSSLGATDLSAWFYYTVAKGFGVGSCAPNSRYTKVMASSQTSEQKQNFANWYSFYRKRIYMARAGAGRAFSELGDKYRVGLTTINNRSLTANSKFLSIQDFDSTQRTSFYNNLYSITPGGSTPLRESLSWVGRYFAKKLASQSIDPVQYSCQKNFSILSTDGYWNGGEGLQLNGALIGNQDGTGTGRPYFDSSNAADTLADVAMYFYKTDLRTNSLSNCSGALGGTINVCSDANDPDGEFQRMSTYTIGLGLSGSLNYVSNYDAPTGDFAAIISGTKNWPSPISNTTTARLDDLWHAAVNGRGRYYSANNADEMAESLSDSLSQIKSKSGSAAAAATSNLEPVAGDNSVYVALYRTGDWYGDLLASDIDLNTGKVKYQLDTNGLPVTGSYQWSAKTELEKQVGANSGDSRGIYFFASSNPNKLASFEYANLGASQKAFFSNLCGSGKLTQCSNLPAAAKATANNGENVVNYLRGQKQDEKKTDADVLPFRQRAFRLGDIVNATPIYAKKPAFQFTEGNYGDFAHAQRNRAGTVYVAANDGMLHAFNSSTGSERWAFVPSSVMSTMHKLADTDYSNNHQFSVDGSPTISDIQSGTEWKTILVGGLNAGGRGYYALDITDPASPKGLWEFSDPNLGATYGNPVVTKLKDGTWVVLVSSGYNNVSPGDGIGRLFVLNATTGAKIREISTGVGNSGTPSGLARVNVWVDSEGDNTADRAYAGDQLGNVWRFDINNDIGASGYDAQKLATLAIGTTPQPITVKPEVAVVKQNGISYKVVLIGTGRLLGNSDLGSTGTQSVYAIKDLSNDTGWGDFRASPSAIKQTLTDGELNGKKVRTASKNNMDWSTNIGWHVDLPTAGERVNIDMQLQLNILAVAGNVPSNNASNPCSAGGGYAWMYYFDLATGSFVPSVSNDKVGELIPGNELAAGFKLVRLPNGRVVSIVTGTGGSLTPVDTPAATSGVIGPAKRTSWRELIHD